MKAIRVTCPQCGATLRVSEGAAQTTCEYCGTASNVLRRTRMLERVVAPNQPSNAPRAVQRHSKAWLVIIMVGVLVPMALAGVCVATSFRQVRQSARTTYPTPRPPAPPPKPPAEQPPIWQGTDNVFIADVDGNGTPELVGRGRRVNAGDIVMLIARELATGKMLWVGDVMGTYTETYQGSLALDGDRLLYASETGEVRAYSTAAGKLLWKAQLDERVEAFCVSGTPATVEALGADHEIRTLDRATGAVTAKRKSRTCPRLPTDDKTPFELAKASGRHNTRLDAQLGLYVDAVLVGPTGARVASGSRTTGTRVTTIAALEPLGLPIKPAEVRAPGPERWRATAAVDGLAADGAPRTMVVGEREVCIVYYAKTYMLACWALADGKRLFDAEAPAFFEGLLIVDRSLIVTGTELRVLDLDTGKRRW